MEPRPRGAASLHELLGMPTRLQLPKIRQLRRAENTTIHSAISEPLISMRARHIC